MNSLTNYNYFRPKEEIYLPDELWENILEQIDPVSLIRASMVSSQLHKVANNERIWKVLADKAEFVLKPTQNLKVELVNIHWFENEYGKKNVPAWYSFYPSLSRAELTGRILKDLEFNCVEIKSGKEFKIKLLAGNTINTSYSGLLPSTIKGKDEGGCELLDYFGTYLEGLVRGYESGFWNGWDIEQDFKIILQEYYVK